MADQPTTKPPPAPPLIYEDTGAAAPLVYFDIVGAYGTMNGSIELELATRILVPKIRRRHRGEVHLVRPPTLHRQCRRQPAQRPRCGVEDAGAAGSEDVGDCRLEAELNRGSIFATRENRAANLQRS